MAHFVFLFGAEGGKQPGEELSRLFFVHLLQVGHPLVFYETHVLSWARDLMPTSTAMLPSSEAPCIRRRFFTHRPVQCEALEDERPIGGKHGRPATPGDIELGHQGPSKKSAVSVGDALDIYM
jgi:hypothetical protein